MPKIFLSYSRSDARFVRKLNKYLDNLGFNVLLDTKHLNGGRSTVPDIQRKIEQSDYLIPVITSRAVRSRWVGPVEIDWALTLQEQGRPIKIVPLLLKPTRTKLPSLASLSYIDFTADFSLAFAKLVQVLPNIEYDELYNLRHELDQENIGDRSLLRILRRMAKRKRKSRRNINWVGLPGPKFMRQMERIERDKDLLNEAYWWLIVYGVLRFKSIERFWDKGKDDYQHSMKYARVAGRGAKLMEDLSTERVDAQDQDKIRTLSSAAQGRHAKAKRSSRHKRYGS